MKNGLVTMISLAALTLPALSQQLPPVVISDASAAPQVEIPEGAFEIAVPNLGTVLPENRNHDDVRVPTRPSMEIVRGEQLLEKSRSFRERSRARRVEITSLGQDRAGTVGEEIPELLIAGDGEEISIELSNAVVDAPVAERVVVMSRLGGGTRSRNVGTRPSTARLVIVSQVGEATAAEAPVAHHVIVIAHENVERPIAQAPTAVATTPEVPEYSRPEPEPPSAVELMAAASAGYSLSNAAPNPVSTSASISFSLPRAGRTRLSVFDNAGRVVATLADETLDAGAHTRTFDASGLPAGLYLYRLSSGGYAETKTMTVVR